MRQEKHCPTRLVAFLLGWSALLFGLVLPALPSLQSGSEAHAWAGGQSPAAAAQQTQGSCWSPTHQAAPCPSAAAADSVRSALTVNPNATCKVAVFDLDGVGYDQALADVLNTDPTIQAVAVSQATIESGGLSGFNTLVARLDAAGPSTTQAFQAIQSFVAGGGGYVGEWWGAGAAFSGLGTAVNFNYVPPFSFLNFFTGQASDGYFIETGHPITVTAGHPVTQGLPAVFSAGGGTEFFVRAIPPFDPRLSVLATYSGYGGTNPAIMAGNQGSANVVLLLFDAIDNPSDPNLKQLWINSVKFTCGAPVITFDLCIQDDSNGNRLQINTATGDYQFTNCAGLTVGGTGTVTKRGSLVAFQHSASDRRLTASIDTAAKKASGSLQFFAPARTFSITDRNTANDTCACN